MTRHRTTIPVDDVVELMLDDCSGGLPAAIARVLNIPVGDVLRVGNGWRTARDRKRVPVWRKGQLDMFTVEYRRPS